VTSENPANPPTPATPQTHENGDDKATDPQGAQLPTFRKEVQIPPSHTYDAITRPKKRDGWDRAKMAAEFIGILFLIIYTLYTCGIYRANRVAAQATQDTFHEIQKQTTLMRQQLVGTQAATIVFSEARWDLDKRNLTITFQNEGTVTGIMTTLSLTIQRKTYPDQTPIGSAVHISLSKQEIVKTQPLQLEKALPWALPEVKDQNNWPGKEIATIEGEYSYDNGFGDIFSHKLCILWLPRWNLSMPAPNQGGWSGGGWTGRDQFCPLQERVNDFFGIKQHIKDASTPHP
jgi:hypothetical protein